MQIHEIVHNLRDNNNQEILYLHEQLDIDIKETIPSLNGDLESLNGDLEISITFRAKIDISNINEIRAFLNTSLNQFSINENKYSFVGKGQIYEVQDDETDEARKYKKYGLVIRHGNSKGVQFINNDSGAILAMDYKKSVFYSGNASFLDVIKNCLSINLSYAEISELYKNVQLQVIHQPGEYFRFENFTNDIKDLQVKSMGEYFQNQYDQIIEMEYKAVMVHPECVYLLETLKIVPDQKISKEKLSTLKLDTKNLSIEQRLEGIKNQYANMQFNNCITEAFGINVSTEMIKAEYVQLSAPYIIAGDNKSINPNEDGTFRFDRDHSYCEIASIKNLFVYGCPEKWKQILQKQLKERKITVENIYCNNNPKDISTFEQWKNKLAKIDPSVDYVIVITKTQDIHDLLNLLQIKTGIRIQHILEATTQINACIFNIIHKMNHKAKGFNWKVGFKGGKLDLSSTDRHKIIIGSDVCRPLVKKNAISLADKAACVGIVSNSQSNPFGFDATFMYQKAGQEIITSDSAEHETDLFYEKITEIFRKFLKDKEADIIYTRDGVSESQYQNVIDFEISIIKKAAEKYFGASKYKILALIVTKSGNTRFFNTQNNAINNLPPRSVISLGNRNAFEQFHCIPHLVKSKQGTTKSLMVTVLENQVGAQIKEIQTFLLALCHLHQSHCGPIGLPAPVFLADKIAYKGYKMLAAYEKYIPEQDQFNENIDHPDFYKKLTMAITKRFDVQDQQHSTSTT